jgi:hypothetical protein
MRRVLGLTSLMLPALLGLLGCHSDANLRPPKQPEAYRLPPESDPRFSEPVSYPKQLLFQDAIHKADQDPSEKGPGFHAGGPGGPGTR